MPALNRGFASLTAQSHRHVGNRRTLYDISPLLLKWGTMFPEKIMHVQFETELSRSEVVDRLNTLSKGEPDEQRRIGKGTGQASVAGQIRVAALKPDVFKLQLENAGPYPLAWNVEVVQSVMGKGSKVCVTDRSLGMWASMFVVLAAWILAPSVWNGLSLTFYMGGLMGLMALTAVVTGHVAWQRYGESKRIEEVLKAVLA